MEFARPVPAMAVSCPFRFVRPHRNEVVAMPTNRMTARDVLLAYLEAPRVTIVPGADGLTMDEAVEFYPLAVASGQAPDLRELASRHPAMAADLIGFFAARGWPG